MHLIRLLQGAAPPEVDLTRTYDAIVIGSGAAGGMAAHVLTSHGMKVLMLEAGKKLDIDKELKSMEWPYEHPRRGEMPPGHHALTLNEYTIRQPPYAAGLKFTKVYSYVQGWSGPDYSKNIVVDEKEHPYTGTNYAWVRARCLGGKTNIWGRLALRLSDYDFKAKSRDGYGEDWPISYKDIEPYYDRVDQYLGISGVKENLPHLPDSIFQRPTRLNCRRGDAAHVAEEDGPRAHAVPRRRDDRRAEAQQVSQPVLRPRGVQPPRRRLRHPRGRSTRRPGLIYPAMDTGNLTLRTNAIAREILVDHKTGKARGVVVRRRRDRPHLRGARAKVVVVAASTLESARLLLLSKSGVASERHRQLERPRRPQLLRARHGPGRHRPGQGPRSASRGRSTTGGRAGSTCRGSGTCPTGIRTSSAPTASRAAPGTHDVSRQCAADARLRRGLQEARCATTRARSSAWAASARCWRATRTRSSSTRC